MTTEGPPPRYARAIERNARRNRIIDVLGAVFWLAMLAVIVGGIVAAFVL